MAVGVIAKAQGAGVLPDKSGEGCRGFVLGDDVEIVEGDETH